MKYILSLTAGIIDVARVECGRASSTTEWPAVSAGCELVVTRPAAQSPLLSPAREYKTELSQQSQLTQSTQLIQNTLSTVITVNTNNLKQ